jgi:spore maturation protein CgeB
MNIVILGLSITSSWGNGHATTYRSLVKGLFKKGHHVHFLERDVPWYSNQRDCIHFNYCKTSLYTSLSDLKLRFEKDVQKADLVILGSYVPEGVEAGKWIFETATGITAFYDIDTPVTLGKLESDDFEYIHPDIIPEFDFYFSFSGGPVLDVFMSKYGAQKARPLYCSVDPDLYYPEETVQKWDLGYLGTYSTDRQPPLQKLLIEAAERWTEGRFAVAGPQYPPSITWPANVDRIEHLPPAEHRKFYNEQRFTLNITRKDMIRMGYSPSVRLFEAAACGVPVISDYWEGLDDFFRFGEEILISHSADDSLKYLNDISGEERQRIGHHARMKVLDSHTGIRRAEELEMYVRELNPKGLVSS